MKPLSAPEASYEKLPTSGSVSQKAAAFHLLTHKSAGLRADTRLDIARSIISVDNPCFKQLELALLEVDKIVDLDEQVARM